MSNEIRINVVAYLEVTSNRVFYTGELPNGTVLEEYSRNIVGPGYLNSLEDIAEAIEFGVMDIIGENNYKETLPPNIVFTSRREEDYGHAYISNDGTYIQRKLNEEELERLVKLTDARLRPKLYDNK
ncbi:hypothetical protein J4221_06800 [Candidatus Pacearchaeota archaeon]|nr:hypothetical protein [Candidatus Pacearchaeota archaeon]